MTNLILATEKGIAVCERDGDHWKETARTLADQNVKSVIARKGVILAGTRKGVFRSDDEGQ